MDPQGKRVRVSFDKRKDAEAELGKRVSLIAEGRYLDVKRDYTTTLKELIGRYRENFQDQTSYKTSKQYSLEIIKEYFKEETRLANIQYVDLETFRNWIRRTPSTRTKGLRTDATVNRHMACLRHLFTKAAEWQLVERSPFEKGKSLNFKESNQRIRYLSEDEIGRLLVECPLHLQRIVICAIQTGMRRGEILSLKWNQVRNGFIYLAKTKSKAPRQIPINDELEDLFKEIRKDQHLRSEYVFTYQGERVREVKTSFRAACRRAGIENFRFHDLRHTAASHLVMRGVDLKTVQELLGHKTISMTLRYSHLAESHKRDAINRLNGLTGKIDKNTGILSSHC